MCQHGSEKSWKRDQYWCQRQSPAPGEIKWQGREAQLVITSPVRVSPRGVMRPVTATQAKRRVNRLQTDNNCRQNPPPILLVTLMQMSPPVASERTTLKTNLLTVLHSLNTWTWRSLFSELLVQDQSRFEQLSLTLSFCSLALFFFLSLPLSSHQSPTHTQSCPWVLAL